MSDNSAAIAGSLQSQVCLALSKVCFFSAASSDTTGREETYGGRRLICKVPVVCHAHGCKKPHAQRTQPLAAHTESMCAKAGV